MRFRSGFSPKCHILGYICNVLIELAMLKPKCHQDGTQLKIKSKLYTTNINHHDIITYLRYNM